ncbi:MAG: glycosyltransferase [Sphingobacteriales bacterium]|nr:MAG: glycosyltransferase [Sphingobacteriales bacterium]
MKIFQLIQKPQLRGAEVFACQLSTHLNSLGHESIIVPVFGGNVTLPFDGTILPLNANPAKRFADTKGWKQLATLIRQHNPDVIQANAGDTLKYAACSKMLHGWKQPVVFRNASTISLYIKSAPAKLLNGFFLKKVDYVASVSNVSKDDFLTLYPAFKTRISKLPIGVNEVSLQPKKQSPNPILIHVGGFTYEKNHTGLISIFEKVLQRHKDAVLWLVGDGPLRSSVEELVKSKGLDGKVTFYGFRQDALQLQNQANVLLLPSIIEGLPGVILEAFYCKTAVVAYNVGGIKEVVTDATGALVPLHNEQEFADRVCAIVDDKRSVAAKVDNSYELVRNEYMNRVIAGRFADVYKSVAGK